MRVNQLLLVAAVCIFSTAKAMRIKQTFKTQAEMDAYYIRNNEPQVKAARLGRQLAPICSVCKGKRTAAPPVPSTLFRERFNMDHLLINFDLEEDRFNPGNIIKKLQAIVNAVKETVDDIVNEFIIPAILSQVCQVCNFIQKIPPPPTLPPLPTALPTLPPFPTNLPTFPPFPPKSARD